MITGIIGLVSNIFAPAANTLALINNGIDLLLFVIAKLAFLLIAYGCIFALLGKYAEIPGLSRLVYRQLKY